MTATDLRGATIRSPLTWPLKNRDIADAGVVELASMADAPKTFVLAPLILIFAEGGESQSCLLAETEVPVEDVGAATRLVPLDVDQYIAEKMLGWATDVEEAAEGGDDGGTAGQRPGADLGGGVGPEEFDQAVQSRSSMPRATLNKVRWISRSASRSSRVIGFIILRSVGWRAARGRCGRAGWRRPRSRGFPGYRGSRR